MSFRSTVVVVLLAVAGCATTPRNAGLPEAYSGTAREATWDYPETYRWPDECRRGQQSPINFAHARNVIPWKVAHVVTQATLDPHDRNVVFAPTGAPSLRIEPDPTRQGARGVYTPIGFHFHNGREHVVAGSAQLEMHIKATDGADTAVFAVQWNGDGGIDDPVLVQAADSLVPGPGTPVAVDLGRVLRRFANPQASFYSYIGSLTTPPCTGGIRWFVLQEPISTTRSSIDRLTTALVMNGVSPQNARGTKDLAPTTQVHLITPKNPRP